MGIEIETWGIYRRVKERKKDARLHTRERQQQRSQHGYKGQVVTSWDEVPIESWCRVLCAHEPQRGPLIGGGSPWAKGRRAFAGRQWGQELINSRLALDDWTGYLQMAGSVHRFTRSFQRDLMYLLQVPAVPSTHPSLSLLRSRVVAQHVRPGLAGNCWCSPTDSGVH